MVRLTAEEQAMLAGKEGAATQKAMEIIVALAEIYGAEELVPVSHVQVAGVSYKNLGDAGLEFLQEWAAQGARVRVPTTLNPAGMDLKAWRELGIPEDFARKQSQIVETYTVMGIQPTLTCTPYSLGYRPRFGEHVAWSESSAVSFANSVLGARTNREGGPGALAAAIVGRTPRCGFHLDSARLATHRVDVCCDLANEADFGALGYLVGKLVGNGVPFFRFWGKHPAINAEDGGRGESLLKSLGAAMAASGAVGLYHIEGITPEARQRDVLSAEATPVMIESLKEAFAALNGAATGLDLISIGCPHSSLSEIARVADLVRGKRLRVPLWVTAARQTQMEAERLGLARTIAEAGGRVLSDTCIVVAPVELLGYKRIATNSAKAAFYLASQSGVSVRFGSLERCVEAGLHGHWT